MRHLVYLSATRYPTEKAYGVTVGNTVSVLNHLNLKTTILVWGTAENDSFQNDIESVTSKSSTSGFNIKIKLVAKSAFIFQMIRKGFAILSSKCATNGETILWTREPLVLLPHAIFSLNKKYMFELHHSISQFTKVLIKLIAKRHQVKILALTHSALRDYATSFKDIEIYEVPMGVPQNFFEVQRLSQSEKFVIGYLGKGMSSGNDNRIDRIIIGAVLLKSIERIEYWFVGLEDNYEKSLRDLIVNLQLDPVKFRFIKQVNHTDIPRILMGFSVGVIPYPKSKYNDERFPLKALEYAASGLPIIATDTQANHRLLNDAFTNFFDENSSEEFANAVLDLYESREVHEAKSSKAREFAKEFTYEQRAKKIIDLIESYN